MEDRDNYGCVYTHTLTHLLTLTLEVDTSYAPTLLRADRWALRLHSSLHLHLHLHLDVYIYIQHYMYLPICSLQVLYCTNFEGT